MDQIAKNQIIEANLAKITHKVMDAMKSNSRPLDITLNKVSVDEYGLDASGRIVACYGSPVIDGSLDPIWYGAPAIIPTIRSGETDVKATFRLLWDDQALYVLAEVSDQHLSIASDTPHEQDSVEIYVGELNDKAKEYGPYDLHIRVNCENIMSVDNGRSERYYSAAGMREGGYYITARIALHTPPDNGSVLAIELQVNDAMGEALVGSLHVFDRTGTAWKDPSRFGELLLTGKTEASISGLNPYELLNATRSTLKLDASHYTNVHVVTDAVVAAANSLLRADEVTQSRIDAEYAAIQNAISKLELTPEAANEKQFSLIPDMYRMMCHRPGTIETLHYQAPNPQHGKDDKKLHVYLPYGYDAADQSKKYNVLYLLHGGGENEDLLFGGPGENRELKRIIDHLIACGDMDPLIVVTPTFYGGMNDVALFHDELIHTIVPFVETRYNTYLGSAGLEDVRATRAHRAFGGFSMGSVTTWHTFVHKLDYIKYFVPLSGDSWALGHKSGGEQPVETAAFLADAARKSGYAPQDYYIFSATGNQDIAYPNLHPQILEMKKHTDVFRYSSDLSKGNFYFLEADGGTHHWYWQNQYLYHILPDLFVQE